MTQLTARERDRLQATIAAGRAADQLRPLVEPSDPTALVTIGVGGVEAALPMAALAALVDVLEDFSEGNDITVAPADLAVGTAEAARLLGVSRTWIAELIDRGELAGERVGTKRRVPLGALVTQRRAQAARQRECVRSLADATFAEGVASPAPADPATEGAGLFVRGDVRVRSVPERIQESASELSHIEPSRYGPPAMAA